ncbi:hypothetical protein AC578_3311 [Pseudocercospora eumusae]|uniref:Uncharacterized protein n=1 Tax=Pseudocercospora eumusae TaxID=321146 RepID=A0A139HCJ1_9PEZI|nr:hypothetical protein AC578_3311 [Pseudocercospora eumusae]
MSHSGSPPRYSEATKDRPAVEVLEKRPEELEKQSKLSQIKAIFKERSSNSNGNGFRSIVSGEAHNRYHPMQKLAESHSSQMRFQS